MLDAQNAKYGNVDHICGSIAIVERLWPKIKSIAVAHGARCSPVLEEALIS